MLTNLTEMILVNRVAKIYKAALTTEDPSDVYLKRLDPMSDPYISKISHGNFLYKEAVTSTDHVTLQQNLKMLFEYMFPGSLLHKFVVAENTPLDSECRHLPIFMLEIFTPKHIYIPMIVTTSTLLFVAPFSSPSIKNYTGNDFFMELMPTSVLATLSSTNIIEQESFGTCKSSEDIQKNDIPDAFKLDALEDDDIPNLWIGIGPLKKLIEDIISTDFYALQISTLYDNFGDMSMNYADIISRQSTAYQILSKKYEVPNPNMTASGNESVEFDAIRENVGLITEFDYMPIYIKSEDPRNSGFVFLEKITDDTNKVKTVIKIAPSTEDTGFYPIGGELQQKSIVLLSDDKPTSVIELTSDMYYIGHNQIRLYYDTSYSDIDISEITEAGIDPFGNEGVFEDIVSTLKTLGIKSGSVLSQLLSFLLKLPKKIVKDVIKAFKDIFKIAKEVEKNDTLEYQEKALNDTLDVISDLYSHIVRVIAFSSAILFAFASLQAFFIGIIIAQWGDSKIRSKALERLEFKLNGIIERLDTKIKFAENESDYQGVDKLLQERQMYQLTLKQVIEHRKALYSKTLAGIIKGEKKYKRATFEDELAAPETRSNGNYSYA